MPSLCGFSWSDELDTIIVDKSAQHGVPLDLSYAIIAAESGFNVRALGDVGCSSGLLQLNTCGGQGMGYTVEQLYDPRLNLDIGLPYIATAFRMIWSPTIPQFDYLLGVMLNSGHPCNSPDAWCYTLPGDIPRRCSDPQSGCYHAVERTFVIWQCFYNALLPIIAQQPPPPPVITGNPPVPVSPPWPQPIPPFQNMPSEGMPVLFWLLLGAAAVIALRPTIYKKVIVKQPTGTVKIIKK